MQEPNIYYCHKTEQLMVAQPEGRYEIVFEPPKQCENHYLGFKVGDFVQGWTEANKDLYAMILVLWKAKDHLELVHYQPNELRRKKRLSTINEYRTVKSAEEIIAFFNKHRKEINSK